MPGNDETHRSMTHGSGLRREDWLLLLVALLPPVVWSVRFLVVYPLVQVACVTGNLWPINLVTLASLGITMAAGVVAWRTWKRLTAGERSIMAGPRTRPEFMAFTGVLFSGFFLALILVEWSPVFVLNPCEAGL